MYVHSFHLRREHTPSLRFCLRYCSIKKLNLFYIYAAEPYITPHKYLNGTQANRCHIVPSASGAIHSLSAGANGNTACRITCCAL